MSSTTETETPRRLPLTRERVLQAAVAVADHGGIQALTMRNVAQELGVEAMSLYHHVANKEDLLDGVVEEVLGEIEAALVRVAQSDGDWKGVMRSRILTARDVMLRHPWAPGVIETRTSIGLATLRYFDALLGIFRRGGFSYDLAHHAMHVLGSRALGFNQELFEPDEPTADGDETMAMMEEMADQFPHLVGMMSEVAHVETDSTLGWCDDQTEFEFGLDLILDGLDRLNQRG